MFWFDMAPDPIRPPDEVLYQMTRDLGISDESTRQYLTDLDNHLQYVHEAGVELGVPPDQLRVHDASKFSALEFPYAVGHHVDRAFGNEYAAAWLHHVSLNPHHHQHWRFSDGFTPDWASDVEDGILPMPWNFVLEMVADWMGSSRAYSGSWDMSKWLVENMPTINLHSKTARDLRQVLTDRGYGPIAGNTPFARELP